MLVVSTLLVVSWGAFAFGAVYPWGYLPLAAACALVGVAGLTLGRVPPGRTRGVFLGLAGILLLGLVQLVPLPQNALAAVSPGTERFLRAYDLTYALGGQVGADGALVPTAVRHAISVVPASTRLALLLLASFSLFLAGLLRITSGSVALRLAKGLVFVGTILALVGIVQKAALGDNAFLGMRIYGLWAPDFLLTTPFGPFINKNHFAGWMLMALPLAFGLVMRAIERDAEALRRGLRSKLLWLSSPDGGQVVLLTFAALLMALSLIMTRSRSGLACFVAVSVAASIVAARRLGSTRQGVALATALAVFLGVAFVWAGAETAVGRVTTEPQSVQLRLSIWRVAMAIWRDFPLLGAGLDTFGIATINYQTAGDLHYQEAHNDYVQILAEGGLVLLAMVGLTIVAVGRTIANRFRSPADRRDLYWLRVGATLGLMGIALQSAVEFSLQMPGNAAMFAVLLALALYSPTSTPQRGELNIS